MLWNLFYRLIFWLLFLLGKNCDTRGAKYVSFFFTVIFCRFLSFFLKFFHFFHFIIETRVTEYLQLDNWIWRLLSYFCWSCILFSVFIMKKNAHWYEIWRCYLEILFFISITHTLKDLKPSFSQNALIHCFNQLSLSIDIWKISVVLAHYTFFVL